MKVLIVGNGGRENALAEALQQSPMVKEIIRTGTNAGIHRLSKCEFQWSTEDPGDLAQLAIDNRVGLTIVGPEAPLAFGIVDTFKSYGLKIFGPTKAAARLEWDKSFAKFVMQRTGVPTASSKAYTKGQANKAKQHASNLVKDHKAVVVKANGLAGGKGVTIAYTLPEAERAIDDILVRDKHNGFAQGLVIEDFLYGSSTYPRPELTVMGIVDVFGDVVLLPPSQDYKPRFEKDLGPMTGGMGAYSPVPFVTDNLLDEIKETIFKPVIEWMKLRGTPFTGVLYAGLMLTDDGPKVIEFNTRFGDPELQAIMPRFADPTQLVEMMWVVANGRSVKDVPLEVKPAASVCVVICDKDYPESYKKRRIPERWLTSTDSVKVYRSGSFIGQGPEWEYSDGGRVLCVTGFGETYYEARQNVHGFLGKKERHFDWREDIAMF
jgi:phosphoribosylamine---glycine ligase